MDPKILSLWGAIIVSVVTLSTFTGALVVSFLTLSYSKDPDVLKLTTSLLNLTVGAAIANATTAVGFWLGSSSGSQKKDEVIGAALRASSGAAPVVTAISPKGGGVAGGTNVTITGSWDHERHFGAVRRQRGELNDIWFRHADHCDEPPGVVGPVDVTVATLGRHLGHHARGQVYISMSLLL